jgi:Phosphate/sulphate permeases
MTADLTLVLAILMAFAFALTNGFHDAANSIATLVATRVARPLRAVAMASVFNLIGPLLFGAAVANTVGKLVTVDPSHGVPVIGAGLTGAVIWNTYTWRRNLPSSSSHALVGGLVGAALLDSGPGSINLGPIQDGHLYGVLGVLLGLVVATVLGFAVAFLVERIALRATRRASARLHGPVRSAQWVTSAFLAFSHGSNDAQKTVGIVAGLLLASGNATNLTAPLPVILGASLAMTIGTAFGGWGIIKTVGKRIFPIRSLDGLVSQSSSASVIFVASLVGAPVSTTQVVSSSIVGIGVGRSRWRHVSWQVVREIALAWLTTMPVAGLIAALTLPIWKFLQGG